MMENKTQILLRLLDEKKITMEEAKVLAETDKYYMEAPYIPYPIYPSLPFTYPNFQYIPEFQPYYTASFNIFSVATN